jgi:8-oxo-dGTP diphosphatase
MAARDGDGWVNCGCGNKHWGLNGAAGILIVRGSQILLQHRAPWVHNGDTWGIPGGARDSHETTIDGAFREAVEETGIDTSLLTALHTFTDDHGDWKYETVIALATSELVAHEVNVEQLPLHPSFAKSWPELMKLLNNLISPT